MASPGRSSIVARLHWKGKVCVLRLSSSAYILPAASRDRRSPAGLGNLKPKLLLVMFGPRPLSPLEPSHRGTATGPGGPGSAGSLRLRRITVTVTDPASDIWNLALHDIIYDIRSL